ncbi:hypothetical protein GQ43DRAFT_415631 [Delitschia confertaspora ATCC 74209]|uniref:D-serine dehydratase n=1 Tax=Delitschia confertaspora ATCC 74209 TaxID=1513339 RepID=A0A9P4MVV9_9PLEO|nr:hypothetical protein GQ43DRAFT_415631 [Delitschia confertaspora ATCC 74209]
MSHGYLFPSQSSLMLQYVGKTLEEISPIPAAVLDRAIVKKNCDAMLGACKELGMGFRAHVKSHKTLELAKLQVGEDGPANFIVSTILEAEQLAPYLRECQAKGRECSILYGVPVPPSAAPRLMKLDSLLKPYSINVLVDHIDNFKPFWAEAQKWYGEETPKVGVFIKIDTGYGRAGIKSTSSKFDELVRHVAEHAETGFKGFYSHLGNSYAGSNQHDAMTGLLKEFRGLGSAAASVHETLKRKLILTVGATPTATVAQNMVLAKEALDVPDIRKLRSMYDFELHAGVYPLLDLQQVATNARPANLTPSKGSQPLSLSNIGLKILVEVTSVYDDREKPEALISAGSLALGREPCKSYPGWGIVSNELANREGDAYDDRGNKRGWIVGRVSQEHGVLSWEGPREDMKHLKVGDKLLIWPNHACIAGSGFGCYLVVDSDLDEKSQKVVDVWVRWRGW